MTKSKALYDFFNSFGIPAYPSTSVPDDVTFPYMTYENTLSNNGGMTNPTLQLYYYTDSESVPNSKADEISKKIGLGYGIPCDDGVIYAYMGSGWNAIANENDSTIKQRYTNLTLIFNTY